MMNKVVSFLNSRKCGDILYSIPGIRNYCSKNNCKARLYLRPNVKTLHNPTGAQVVEELMLTNESFNLLHPLLMQQDFIDNVQEFEGQPVDFNLDIVSQMKIGAPYGDLMRWYSYAIPQLHATYHEPWLQFRNDEKTAAIVKDTIVVSLSNNYRNHWINYEFLNIFHTEYPINFIGFEHEAKDFISKVPRALWLQCEDWNDIACAVANCKVFIGNQNAVFAVAEGIKVPRILEISPLIPNVLCQGPNGFDFHLQKGLEHYLQECLVPGWVEKSI